MNRHVSPAPTAAPPLRLEAFVQSEEARAALQRIGHQLGIVPATAPREGTLSTAARMVGMADFGDLLIAELAGDSDEAAARAAIAQLAAEGVGVVVLGWRNDIATYRGFLAAGAQDYLVLPLDGPFEIRSGAPEPAQPVVAGPRSRAVAVCGVSGGVGASLLAANLALALGAATEASAAPGGPSPVALLDADLLFGSQAVDFDVPPTSGLLDALLAPARVDRTFLDTTMAMPFEGLSLFSAELADIDALDSHRAGLGHLVGRLRQEFPAVVIDLPRAQLAETPRLADGVDDLVLVLGPGFGSVRAFVRLMDRLGDGGTGPRIWPVLSHTRRDAGLKRSEIAETLERDIVLDLPQCGAELARAQIKGQPLQRLAPRSAYARAVRTLAQKIAAPETETGTKGQHGAASRGRKARSTR
ncbi:AAA family ATPase [Oceanicola sp. S124]|uniref:AAA family ATPase n=1 Tax=Oceanicola sp. S124 TaxID=1042378 RepID=UPI0002559721|nr:pilus assembly protein CpaE [Oceanicola sp. S124]